MAATPTVIFGAFDRHNFGDLLIAQVVARMLPHCERLFAGLAARNSHDDGGPRTVALSHIVAFARGRAVTVIHAGGELLTCNAWEAAVMLASPQRVPALIAAEGEWLRNGRAWAQKHVGVASLAPYALSKSALPGVRVKHLSFNAVGGVDLDARNAQLAADVLTALHSADTVSVRDCQTHALLAQRGIETRLMPDPGSMTAVLFGTTIRRHAARLALREVRQAFPHGYAAVQFSADFGDDATLDTLATQFERVAQPHGLGIVLFRAGAAPWHDDLAVYERLADRLRAGRVRVFASLNVWDICALIAGSRIYCGTSLHGRIVAMAYALPRINISHPDHSFEGSKQAAYVRTWEAASLAGVVHPANLADAVANALATDCEPLRETASALARRYRMEFEAVVKE